MPATDYVTMATHFARLTPGGGELVLEELARTGPDHARSFVSGARASGGYRVEGIGRGGTLKEARHEACRDFIYCVLKNDLNLILETLANDTSICSVTNRAPNKYREGPTTALPQRPVGGLLSKTLTAASKQTGVPVVTFAPSDDEDEQSVPDGKTDRKHPAAAGRAKSDAPDAEFVKVPLKDFEQFISKVMPL
ncbi:hypothetical protein BV898_07967 [Hypsibius exemplaris]|uniref:Uncharacterized protein n=1 Tax=Hypsibius exemplaris TaxID=2072580 RepID=A0A1W0WS49_HYPEX|nr:hypothetical protein BV898_07967 [Hypsibius exemplaris]